MTQAMQARLVCSSHSPLMRMFARPPAAHDQINDMFNRFQVAVNDYNPDLVVVFGCDHFNGFHLNCMPAFCLGTGAYAIADVGGTPGALKVPSGQAMAVAESVRNDDIDIAVSYNMRIDHGFSQTMDYVLGGLDCFPVIPVFINSITPPYVSFRRSRMLGESIARATSASGVRRLLVIGTGGMSHHPRRYYPEPDSAEAPVRHYQLHGPSNSGLTHEQWLARLDTMHQEGARMLVDGRRTISDIKMNPELDQQFARALCGPNRTDIDAWAIPELIEKGGIGFTELHTWVAAAAAFCNAEPGLSPELECYAPTLEYGIGFGAISGGLQ